MAHSETNPTQDAHESEPAPELAEVHLAGDFVHSLDLGCRWLRRKPSLDDYEMNGRG